MGYRNIQTVNQTLNVERMGSFIAKFLTKDNFGNAINIIGSTCHLWVGEPRPSSVITIAFVQVTPGGGYNIFSDHVEMEITEADLASWGLPPGTYPYELLVTDDGGTTTDKLAKGNIVVGSWITNTF